MKATKKQVIMDWISSIDDKEIIEQIFEHRKLKTKNFNENMKHALTANEMREETGVYIKSLNWKKLMFFRKCYPLQKQSYRFHRKQYIYIS